jgi:serine/threonine protein kinase/tetratricopeptide (TPR) repeat protein
MGSFPIDCKRKTAGIEWHSRGVESLSTPLLHLRPEIRVIGQTVSHYTVTRQLGAGGMGIVYEAVDNKLDRTVALKFLPPESTRDPVAKARFVHEAKAASAIDHPNVCSIYEIGETQDGQLFLAMACYEGETLKERISRGRLPVGEALDVARQIAEGLASAHENRMVHRDIKPANIFITSNGLVKILDFGLAKLAGQTLLTKTGTTLGTASYLSPEQAQGQEADFRSDLWSLGVVLYEMITGALPFAGDNYEAVIYGILHIEPPSLSEVRPGLSSPVERIVDRCLSKDPGHRPSSARDLACDLGGCQVQGSFSSREHFPHRPMFRRGFVAALLLVLGLAGAWWFFLKPDSILHEVPSILVAPLEVVGQSEGAEYAGRAFAQAIAVNLAPSRSLHVLPVLAWAEVEPGSQALAQFVKDQEVNLLLNGTIIRSDTVLNISMTLIDATENRVLWGTREVVASSDMARSAVSLSNQVLKYLGGTQSQHYEYFRYVSGSKAMALWDDLPEVISALRSHDISRGLALTERLLVAFPDEHDAHVMRIVALLDASWNDPEIRQKNLPEGLDALERIDPQEPLLTIIRSDLSSDEAQAIEDLTRLLVRQDLTPGCRAHVLRTRGRWYSVGGNTTSAIADLDEAMSLDPANTFNYGYLSRALYRAGRFEEALVRARQSAALDPYLQDDIALAAEKLGLWEEAQRAYAKLAETYGYGDQAVYACNAYSLQMMGKREEAMAAAEAAAQQTDTVAGSLKLAGTWAQLGINDRALHYLQRAVDLGCPYTMLKENEDMFVPLKEVPEYQVFIAEFEARGPKD